MKIKLEDEDVERIAVAVAAKVGKAAGKPAAPKKPAANDAADEFAEGGEGEAGDEAGDEFGDEGGEGGGEEPELTRDDVRAALSRVSKKFDQDTAMGILKTAGKVGALSKLAEDKFKAVVTACNKKAPPKA